MKQTTRADYESRIARVVAAIEADPAASHRLADLAALAHLSPFHFHRIYSAMRGESLFDTIRRARLRRAALALKFSRLKIIDVAQEAGFESAQSFARAFRSLVGVSPTAFRRGGATFADYVSGVAPPFEEENMKVDIIEQPPLRLHALRFEGPVASIGEVWRELWRWIVERQLTDKVELAVGVCRDAPDAQGRVVYYAGVALRGAQQATNGLEILRVAGGRYACYRHVGPYAGIADAFQRLYGVWLPASGFEPDDRPSLDIMRNNPCDTPAQELITDLLIPVK